MPPLAPGSCCARLCLPWMSPSLLGCAGGSWLWATTEQEFKMSSATGPPEGGWWRTGGSRGEEAEGQPFPWPCLDAPGFPQGCEGEGEGTRWLAFSGCEHRGGGSRSVAGPAVS